MESLQQAPFSVLVVTNMWPHDADPSFGCFVHAQMESLRPLGVDYDVLFINGRQSRWNYARAVFDLHRRLRAKRYDLLHAHFGLAGCVARCQFSVPVVATFWGDDAMGQPVRSGRITLMGRFYQISSFLLARVVAASIVQSREMKKMLRLKSAQILPAGIDLELFRPMDRNEARGKLGLGLHKRYVLFPYNPAVERKRYDLIEAAVARARQDVPELEILRVYGLPPGQMPLYYNAADVLVLASLIEGSPNSVKEAMAVNLPVISVKVGDTPELLGSTEGNYLVPRAVEPIAEKIVEVCRRGSRTDSRQFVARLSIESIAQQTVGVYAGAVKQ
jgi:teichuronic acid biosynthesis glycosyltransferase TuaC